jgi:hypothetical protein
MPKGTVEQIRGQKQRHAERAADLVAGAKVVGCSRCPERDPVVLDLHHVRDKSFELSRRNLRGRSLGAIRKEIEKCVVVCANCHRRIHAAKGRV